VALKELWRQGSVRRRDRRMLLSSLNSWRWQEKALEEADMVVQFFDGQGDEEESEG